MVKHNREIYLTTDTERLARNARVGATGHWTRAIQPVAGADDSPRRPWVAGPGDGGRARRFRYGSVGGAMKALKTRLLGGISRAVPEVASFAGSDGRVWFAGPPDRAPSIAEFFCGDDMQRTSSGRLPRTLIADRATAQAMAGTVAVLFPDPKGPALADGAGAIEVPLRITLRKHLPTSQEELLAGLKTSTTQEDLRRIRKAGFTYRISRDPADVRRFFSDFYVPLVRNRFPEDGVVKSLDEMLESVRGAGELLCADLDGEWVAGLFNSDREDDYSMGSLGIRGAEEAIRNKRVVSALIVAAMQRGVELGRPFATLGHSLPFLGKGPIWFKAKWGCELELAKRLQTMRILADLRHTPVQRALALSPIVLVENGAMCVAAWLSPGEGALATLLREAERFAGLSRWYVMAAPETLAAAAAALARDRIVPIAVEAGGPQPLWLGDAIAGASA